MIRKGFHAPRMTTGLIVFLFSTLVVQAQTQIVPKSELSRFIGTLYCVYEGNLCPQAASGFSQQGYMGDPGFEDLNQLPKEASSGRMPVALGFLETPHFDLAKYSFESPLNHHTFLILNELTSGDDNHAMVTEWTVNRSGYSLVKVHPQVLELTVGEMMVASKPMPLGKGFVLLLKGLGSDAGVNLQKFIALKWEPQTGFRILKEVSNSSEIPVSEILARLNDGENSEEVTDSTLVCALARGGKMLRCTKSLTRISYSKQGTEENPIGKNDFSVDLTQDSKR